MTAWPPSRWPTAWHLRAALMDGELTSVDLTQACLDRIAATDAQLGAWLALDAERALERAHAIDHRRARGEPVGPLAGLPVGVKDLICTQGLATTAGSRMLQGFVPPYSATVVTRLEAADGVVLGKLNQDEFGMGSSGEASGFGPTRNPWDPTRVPGGSSSGSAAAVAAEQCPLALGTDTGGSVRQPASFCGVVGLKPTYGRVSRYGVVAYASSLDQVGPVARTTRDAALLLQAIAGHDPLDGTSLPQPAPDLLSALAAAAPDLRGVRVGVPDEYFAEGLQPGIEATVRQALAQLETLGAQLVSVSLPHTRFAIATYYLIATAEASSNLARYDGVRYGHRTGAAVADLDELYARSRAEGFGAEVKRRILLGTYALSSGYYDAYYLRAQKVRTLIRRDFEAAFAQCDVLATPTSPVTAWRLGERVTDPLQMYLMDAFTVPASLAGLPCLSLPCGRDQAGLPIGMQLIGPALGEARLVAVAHAYERATSWHLDRPGADATEAP